MPLFALICTDKADHEPLRKANRDAHLAYLNDTGCVTFAGPFLDAGTMTGSLVVIDVADPAMPVQVAVGPSPLGSFYGATHVPGSDDVLLTASDFVSVHLFRVTIGADGMPSEQWQASRSGVAFPLGAAIDVEAGLALIAVPGPNVLMIQPLDGGAATEVPWQAATGPTYVALGG